MNNERIYTPTHTMPNMYIYLYVHIYYIHICEYHQLNNIHIQLTTQ